MFDFLCFFGPAALTFLIVKRYEREVKEKCVLEQVVFLISCAFVELLMVLMVFMPIGAVQIVTLTNGMRSVHYGRLALLGAFGISIGLGFLICLIRRDIDVSLTLTKKKNEK